MPSYGPIVTSTMDLLDRARDGDNRAIEELCRRYLPRLQRWARGRLPRGAREVMDTHDLVQEAVLASVRRLDHFEARRANAFQSYLRTAVLNRLRSEVDRVRRHPESLHVDSRLCDPAPSPLEELIGSEALDRYERALENLPPTKRELVVARVELGLSYAQIAEELGKASSDAARMAVTRALLSLAEGMRKLEKDSR